MNKAHPDTAFGDLIRTAVWLGVSAGLLVTALSILFIFVL